MHAHMGAMRGGLSSGGERETKVDSGRGVYLSQAGCGAKGCAVHGEAALPPRSRGCAQMAALLLQLRPDVPSKARRRENVAVVPLAVEAVAFRIAASGCVVYQTCLPCALRFEAPRCPRLRAGARTGAASRHGAGQMYHPPAVAGLLGGTWTRPWTVAPR